MSCLKLLMNTASKIISLPRLIPPLQLQCRSDSTVEKTTHRKRSPCEVCIFPPDKKPCFDIRNVTVERGNQSHANQIRSFLYTEYWPREPSVVGLWMCLNCSYLDILTDKYSHSAFQVAFAMGKILGYVGFIRNGSTPNFYISNLEFISHNSKNIQLYTCADVRLSKKSDRLLALEQIKRTGEQKLVGVSVSNKVFPWAADELEEWAHHTMSTPERNRMYFCAHCIKSPNLFQKYNVDFIYEVEVLATAAEVSGQGVGTLLLRTALAHAEELRYPLVQVIAVSQYTSRICEKCGMKREWSMDYSDFVDDAGQRVFFPRRPHHTVSIYTTHNSPSSGYREPCKPPYL